MTLPLDQAVRSAVVVLAGLATVAALRRQSAALRHAVLAAAIVGAAVVPALTAIVPAWQIRVPANLAAQAEPETRAAVPRAADSGPTLLLPATVALPRPPASTAKLPRAAINVVQLAGFAWLAGFALCAAALLTALGRLASTARRATRVQDEDWLAAAERLRAAYGIRRTVTLLRTDAPDELATFGVWRHRVLLPRQAGDWQPDRIDAVLSHELAHVLRRDWLVQMGAEALRCVTGSTRSRGSRARGFVPRASRHATTSCSAAGHRPAPMPDISSTSRASAAIPDGASRSPPCPWPARQRSKGESPSCSTPR